MSPKRKRRPNATERTAAALLAIKKGDGWLIPEPLRSNGTAKEICAYVQFHHDVTPHALGGTSAPQNLSPMSIADHAHETATKTIPMIAKVRRVSAAQEEFRRRMLAKVGINQDQPVSRKRKHAWPSRAIDGSKDSPWKKRMSGKAERRV